MDFRRCIICQQSSNEPLIENPQNYETILQTITDLGLCGDTFYANINENLELYSHSQLKTLNATWHRKCYSRVTHKKYRNSVKKLHLNELEKRTGCKDETNSDLDRSFTRSSTEPYNKENCFFCQDKGTRKFKLHKVTTFNAGSQLRESVEHSSNQTLLVRLNTVIDSNDAHAIDVLYHKVCWNTNVINPSRPKATKRKLVTDEENNDNAIEVHVIMKGENVFVDQIKTLLKSGQVINMASVEELYENVMSSLGIINSSTYTRRKAKYLLQEKISDLEFSIPMQFNQPELLSMKRTKDIALSEVENNKESDLRSVVNAAKILRKKCLNVEPWLFNGTLERTEEHIPYELLLFFRGIVKGTVTDENQLVNKKVFTCREHSILLFITETSNNSPSFNSTIQQTYT